MIMPGKVGGVGNWKIDMESAATAVPRWSGAGSERRPIAATRAAAGRMGSV